VAPKTAVLVHKHKPTFLAVKHCYTFIKKSFSQFKVAILEQLNIAWHGVSIPAQSCCVIESFLCPVLHLLVKCLATKLRTNEQAVVCEILLKN